MTELYEKSIRTLELPAVLEMLAAEAVSPAAKEKVFSLRPSDSRYAVKRSLGETSAAKTMMVLKGSPSFGGAKDICPYIARADMGGMLNTRELLDIAALLQCSRSARAYADGERSGRSEIDYLFASLTTNKFLEEKITTAIMAEDEIADAASAELSLIRRSIRLTESKVREALQKIISSPSYAKALQEAIITTRSGRYVVPVKADHKSSVPGLVHDISASGATLFIEPMAAVSANNDLRQLHAKEKQEIERILFELSADCAEFGEDIVANFKTLLELDVVFAKAKLSYKLKGSEPLLSEREIVLKRARHPLLPKETAVPIDLELGGSYDTLVITGPNTGGKTVSLKTIGLICVMAACGLHIPVDDGSAVPVFGAVLADIGDEQSIEQSLSTFSSHMTNIVKMLSVCDERSLLLFDELGAGTDPVEGAALASAIIDTARSVGSIIAATTHYSELKVYATVTEGVVNASCEFDVETLQPTYRLLIGIPGKSNAFAIGERLGLPKKIIEDARDRVGSESKKFEETIGLLEQERQLLEKDREELGGKLKKAREDEKESERMRQELKLRLEKADEKARQDAQLIIDGARQTAEKTFLELDEMKKRWNKEQNHILKNEARSELRRSLNKAEKDIERPAKRREKKISARQIRVGDIVEITSMGIKAAVTEILEDRTLSLLAGAMKVSAREDEVYLLEGAKAEKSAVRGKSNVVLRDRSESAELDMRGMTTDEAIHVLEQYIDGAVLSKLGKLTIIHGKGTGALREAVHGYLKSNKLVKTYRIGRYGEGESGVTIVELK